MAIFKADGTRITKATFPTSAIAASAQPKVVSADLFSTRRYAYDGDPKPEGSIKELFLRNGAVLTQAQIDALFPAAVITTVSPANGTTAGGTVVTITGQYLDGVTAVTFGGTAGTALTIASDKKLTVTTPAHAAGAVDIVVTADGGTTTKTGGYTYQ